MRTHGQMYESPLQLARRSYLLSTLLAIFPLLNSTSLLNSTTQLSYSPTLNSTPSPSSTLNSPRLSTHTDWPTIYTISDIQSAFTIFKSAGPMVR